MRKAIAVVVGVALLGGVAATANALEPGLYGIQSWSNGVFKIDETTGVATQLSTCSAFLSLSGASFLHGELYATDVLGGPGLYYGSIDVPTGAYTGVHGQDGGVNWHGLASSDAKGLTWSIDQDAGDILKSTDASGATTTIGYAGIDGRGMAYDDNHGILYATTFPGQLYTVDIDTAEATLIGDMGIATDLVGLAYDEFTDTLYANEGGSSMSLYTVDTATGAATLVGANGFVNIDGLAWIPEPCSLGLLVVGVLVARRRR